MWRWVIALFLAAAQAAALPVSAQEAPVIDSMEVDIWPEYDRPGVLVIYRITLDSGVSLPASITLRIPRSADVPSSVAMEDWDGLLYDLNYSVEARGDWISVTFLTPRPRIQLEYYDPRLEIDDQQRQFQYTWPGDYRVEELRLQILQPVNASDMEIQPGMGKSEPEEDGKVFYNRTVEEVPAGISFTFHVTYRKPDNTLAATALPVIPVEPVSPDTAGRTSMRDMLGWVLGILGALLIAGGAFWFWRSGNELPEAVRKRPAPAAKKEARTPFAGPEAEIYCRQCGRRASPGDAYCRTCGTKLG